MAKVPAKVVKLKPANPRIYVDIPASAAGDYDKLQDITKKLLGKLGCPACHSGFDFRFRIENDNIFRADAKMNLTQGLSKQF